MQTLTGYCGLSKEKATKFPLSKKENLVGKLEKREVIYGAPTGSRSTVTGFLIPIQGVSLETSTGFRNTGRRGSGIAKCPSPQKNARNYPNAQGKRTESPFSCLTSQSPPSQNLRGSRGPARVISGASQEKQAAFSGWAYDGLGHCWPLSMFCAVLPARW